MAVDIGKQAARDVLGIRKKQLELDVERDDWLEVKSSFTDVLFHYDDGGLD